MDDRKPAIPLDELGLRSASDRPSAVVETPPAALAESHEPVAPERQSQSAQIEPCQTDASCGNSVVVYHGSEENVARGFLMALRAMGVAEIEQPPEPSKPPFGGAKP
jgi:hypothetical protein